MTEANFGGNYVEDLASAGREYQEPLWVQIARQWGNLGIYGQALDLDRLPTLVDDDSAIAFFRIAGEYLHCTLRPVSRLRLFEARHSD